MNINAKLNLAKKVPKYIFLNLKVLLHVHLKIHPRNAKLHIFEVQVLLQIRKYLRGVVCME